MTGTGIEYFLSAYLTPVEGRLALSGRHDQGVALWMRQGDHVELRRLWEIERLSGQKHHYWPVADVAEMQRLTGDLLADEGLSWADISMSWGTPGLPKHRDLALPPGAQPFSAHSLAHLVTGLLLDLECFRQDTIIALALDVGPDFTLEATSKVEWYAGCVARRGELQFIRVESPAVLYWTCAAIFGVEEGTLMALASACTAKVPCDVDVLLADITTYGGHDEVARTVLPLVTSLVELVNRELTPERRDARFTDEENRQSAVMKIVQEMCERMMIRTIDHVCAVTGVDPKSSHLSVTGGFGLNCPANTRLLEHYGFKSLLTPPCTNDSGQVLGLGLLGLLQEGLLDGTLDLRLPFAGPTVNDLAEGVDEYRTFVRELSQFEPDRFVDDIESGPVAWVEGDAEVGPRALGHRSILADPRSLRSRELLNTYKRRQWWRPVAPIVLAEHATDYFVTDRPSPFMLEAVEVRPAAVERVPAIVHLDGSARIQTLPTEYAGNLRQALLAFTRRTSVPMLCNTSLNDKGEPIVTTAAESLNFCIRRGIQVAYIDGCRVELDTRRGAESQMGPRPRTTRYFEGADTERSRWIAKLRSDGLSDVSIFLLTRTPELTYGGDSLLTAEDINELSDRALLGAPRLQDAARQFFEVYGPAETFSTVSKVQFIDATL